MYNYNLRSFRSISSTILPLLQNRKRLLAITFLVCFGIFTGFFLEACFTTTDRIAVAEPVKQLLSTGNIAVIPSFLSNLLLLLLIYLAGLSLYGFPLSFVLLFVKSMASGFCCNLLGSTASENFIRLFFITFLPTNLMLYPLFILAVLISFNYSITCLQSSSRDTSLHKSYCLVFFILAICIFFATVAESLFFRIYL